MKGNYTYDEAAMKLSPQGAESSADAYQIQSYTKVDFEDEMNFSITPVKSLVEEMNYSAV